MELTLEAIGARIEAFRRKYSLPGPRRTYDGTVESGVCVVRARGVLLAKPLDPRYDVMRSSGRFDWGAATKGCGQLALAMLLDHLDHHPEEIALLRKAAGLPDDSEDATTVAFRVHQTLKFRLLANLPRPGVQCGWKSQWTITSKDVHESLVKIAEAQER